MEIDCAPYEFGVASGHLNMVAGSFEIPKLNESRPFGEDAHFICDKEQTVGVADGVGAWSKEGIDAGVYARDLMNHACCSVEGQARQKGCVDPKQALDEAYVNAEAKGSSTACIITLRKEGLLHAVNLGDSGFLVIRRGRVCFTTRPQQFRFNFPYQIGHKSKMKPDAAEELAVDVNRGDIVVAGTDGLLDNLFPSDIEVIVDKYLKQRKSPTVMASKIALFARQSSLRKDFLSPFTESARSAGLDPTRYMGGKYDDVSSLLATLNRAIEMLCFGGQSPIVMLE